MSMFGGCGSTTEMSSSWGNTQVTVDGNANEWGSGLTNLKDTKVFLGVRNDQDFVYLCLTSADRQFRRQVIGTGLTLWFESEDGQRVGDLYPIGMAGQGRQPSFNPDETPGSDERERIAQQALQDLEILGPGKDDKNLFSIVQSPGISVKVGGSQESGAYELKVPLRKSTEHPYAVEAAAGSTLKISIATGKFDPGSRPGGTGEGRHGDGGGGRPHGGGMSGGGMHEGGGGNGGETPHGARPEPLDVSVKGRLAGSAPVLKA
ncbi:MAG TPA: hypothetical protein DGH68_00165 [Bacteroidetes bacterium]|nr:hypothetical protein [Bacteroidota bacterium]